MHALWLGRTPYRHAWQLQRELAALRADGAVGDVLLLLEHPPTITMGRAARPEHVLADPDRLQRLGVEAVPIDRGGDVTYHGPGQLVGYPVMRLADHRPDLHWYLRQMEEALLEALQAFGVAGRRFAPHTGVWVGERKVAAIGIKVTRWVTTHGFALNVAPRLEGFELIVPCGISDYGVTSLSAATGRELAVEQALPAVARAFSGAFAWVDDPPPRPEMLTPQTRSLLDRAVCL